MIRGDTKYKGIFGKPIYKHRDSEKFLFNEKSWKE